MNCKHKPAKHATAAPTATASAPPSVAPVPSGPAPIPAGICLIPGCGKNVFVEPTGRKHDYCGRRHAEEGRKLGIVRGASPAPVAPVATTTTAATGKTCKYAGCNKAVWVENGVATEYCGRYHAQQSGVTPPAKGGKDKKDCIVQ